MDGRKANTLLSQNFCLMSFACYIVKQHNITGLADEALTISSFELTSSGHYYQPLPDRRWMPITVPANRQFQEQAMICRFQI